MRRGRNRTRVEWQKGQKVLGGGIWAQEGEERRKETGRNMEQLWWQSDGRETCHQIAQPCVYIKNRSSGLGSFIEPIY